MTGIDALGRSISPQSGTEDREQGDQRHGRRHRDRPPDRTPGRRRSSARWGDFSRHRLAKGFAARPAGVRNLFEGPHDRPGKGRSDSRPGLVDRRGPVENLFRDHGPVGAGKGRCPGDHFVGDDAEGIEIASPVEFFAGGLLRAHVGRRSHDRARTRVPFPALGQPRDPEVGQQRPRLVGCSVEENVFRLEVAMNHAGRTGGIESVGDIGGDSCRDGRLEAPVPGQALAQCFAREIVHHVVQLSGDLAGGMDRDDVGMTELRDGPGLGQKPSRHGSVR